MAKKVLTNDDLIKMVGEDITEFVTQNLGIYERHICAEDESAADLAEHAARNAIADAGISAENIDLIIIATDTGEYIFPCNFGRRSASHRRGKRRYLRHELRVCRICNGTRHCG